MCELNRPLVSIIMPCYNCEKYISQAIESIITQTVHNWELIVVDDHSMDSTFNIVSTYSDNYESIKCIRMDCHEGPSTARNIAMSKARGTYYAFLDSDDIWLPEKLEKQLSFMIDNQYAFTCTGYGIMNESGEKAGKIKIPPRRTNYDKCVLLSNPLGNLTVMYNHDVVGDISVPNIERRNDYALWLQILKKVKYCYGMNEILAVYRKDSAYSISSRKYELIKFQFILYYKIEGHDLFRTIFELICWAFVKTFNIVCIRNGNW